MRRILFAVLLSAATSLLSAQILVTENRQHAFPDSIPAGNYSGIAWLGGNRYAVVSDKSKEDGFFIFEIAVDSVSGDILSARNMGFRSSGYANRDDEGIAYVPQTHTLYISGEADNRILEYNMDGLRTMREARLPANFPKPAGNLGLEALSYNVKTQTLWTCNESGEIHIQSFDSRLNPQNTYRYALNSPDNDGATAQHYAHGIGTICALDDGTLLVLEREFYVPNGKLGAYVNCKLFRFQPDDAAKELLITWHTSLGLFSQDLANYEGMCLGPKLTDGSRVLLLVADSQNQYGGVLKDWMKTLKLSGVGLP